MLWAKHLLLDLDHCSILRFRLGILALGKKCAGKISSAAKRFAMLWAKHLLLDLDHCPILRLRLGVLTLAEKDKGQSIAQPQYSLVFLTASGPVFL